MKVTLIKKENKSVGWQMEPENEDEKLILGTIRNLQYFGFNKTAIKYSGVKTEGNYVTEIKWIQQKHH